MPSPIDLSFDSPIRVTLFGPPGVWVNGTIHKFKRRKSLALVAYLAAMQQQQSRVHLAVLLFPDAPAQMSNQQLRNCIFDISQSPLGEYLLIDGYDLKLDPRLNVDIWQFLNGITNDVKHLKCQQGNLSPQCVTLFSEILALYTGSFMGSFQVHDAHEFDVWQNMQVLRFQYYVEDMLMALAEHYTEHRADDSAITIGLQLLALDSYNEEAVQMLMHIHARNQHFELALNYYESLRRALLKQGTLSPNERTTNLYNEICYGRYKRHTSILHLDQPTRNLLPKQPALCVGREQDIQNIKHLLGVGTDAPGLSEVILVGGLGVGKTVLPAQLAYDDEMQAAFPDGVLWASVGKTAQIDDLLKLWMDALHIPILQHTHTTEQLAMQLASGLHDKRLLLFMDNVQSLAVQHYLSWSKSQSATIMTVPSLKMARQLTTQAQAIYTVRPLSLSDAFTLLEGIAPTLTSMHPASAEHLINIYQGYPFFLELMVREYNRRRLIEDELIILNDLVRHPYVFHAPLSHPEGALFHPSLEERVEATIAPLGAGTLSPLIALMKQHPGRHQFKYDSLNKPVLNVFVNEGWVTLSDNDLVFNLHLAIATYIQHSLANTSHLSPD